MEVGVVDVLGGIVGEDSDGDVVMVSIGGIVGEDPDKNIVVMTVVSIGGIVGEAGEDSDGDVVVVSWSRLNGVRNARSVEGDAELCRAVRWKTDFNPDITADRNCPTLHRKP